MCNLYLLYNNVCHLAKLRFDINFNLYSGGSLEYGKIYNRLIRDHMIINCVQ